MRSRVYYYPSATKGGYSNPYSVNYKKALETEFRVLDVKNKPALALGLSFFINSFRADIYIINWLESICFLRFSILQYILARIGLCIIKLRKKRIVWMFHNIHPHQGTNKYSNKIRQILFRDATLIISHSTQAALYAQTQTSQRVIYICHPAKILAVKPWKNVPFSDVLIWGTIYPYKGIQEFLISLHQSKINLKVQIVGKCNNEILSNSIKSLCKKNIVYENRHVSFDELAGLIANSRYVLFPYIGDCVSSSGALIDSIAMGGNVIGPNIGAFKDLSNENVCLVYNNIDELFSILDKPITIDEIHRKKFIERNSWELFSHSLKKYIL